MVSSGADTATSQFVANHQQGSRGIAESGAEAWVACNLAGSSLKQIAKLGLAFGFQAVFRQSEHGILSWSFPLPTTGRVTGGVVESEALTDALPAIERMTGEGFTPCIPPSWESD
jgi:hypothetical protein